MYIHKYIYIYIYISLYIYICVCIYRYSAPTFQDHLVLKGTDQVENQTALTAKMDRQEAQAFGDLGSQGPSQRTQYSLIKEYTLNHKAPITYGIFLNYGVLGSLGWP